MLLVKDQSALRVELTILLLIGPLFPEAMNVWSIHPIGSHMLATRCPQNLSFHGSVWLPREKCLPQAPPKFRCPVMSSWIDASADVLLSFWINRGVCWSGIKRWRASCLMYTPCVEGEVVHIKLWRRGGIWVALKDVLLTSEINPDVGTSKKPGSARQQVSEWAVSNDFGLLPIVWEANFV